jgi:hypothetical protein
MKIDYHPHKRGFPFKTLQYLYDEGESEGVDIQESIGLNEWAKQKGLIFYDRANIVMDGIFRRLIKKKLITKTGRDKYKLTRMGMQFIEEYV